MDIFSSSTSNYQPQFYQYQNNPFKEERLKQKQSCAPSFDNWECGYPMTSVFKIFFVLILILFILGLLGALFLRQKFKEITLNDVLNDIIEKAKTDPQLQETRDEIIKLMRENNLDGNTSLKDNVHKLWSITTKKNINKVINGIAGNRNNNNNNNTIEEKYPIIVWYSADWCGYCQRFKANWQKIQEEFKTQPIVFMKYDCTNPELNELVHTRKIKNTSTNQDETINHFPYFSVRLPGKPEEKIELNALSQLDQWKQKLNSILHDHYTI
jgi:thiol-disulfide isomerase/thioredoxin